MRSSKLSIYVVVGEALKCENLTVIRKGQVSGDRKFHNTRLGGNVKRSYSLSSLRDRKEDKLDVLWFDKSYADTVRDTTDLGLGLLKVDSRPRLPSLLR